MVLKDYNRSTQRISKYVEIALTNIATKKNKEEKNSHNSLSSLFFVLRQKISNSELSHTRAKLVNNLRKKTLTTIRKYSRGTGFLHRKYDLTSLGK